MNIAVFDHIGNWGGGSRFARALLPALKEEAPLTRITFFGNRASLIRDNLTGDFVKAGIEVRYLASTIVREHNLLYKITRKIAGIFRPDSRLPSSMFPGAELHKEIGALAAGYDLAFFPWPFFIDCPPLPCPMVGVFHDFNYKYFFGTPVFSEEQVQALNRQTGAWLSKVTPVVSSRFIASELAKFYPAAADKVEVVPLAPFDISGIPESDARNMVIALGIQTPYLLCPTNTSSHKNVGILLHAMHLLRRKGVPLTLVMTGPGTECATGKTSAHGVEKTSTDPDVIGLGYVSNLQMDALIQCAKVVISTSLYEAGYGPGLEAWGRGVPVVMSNIPSFVEHLEVLGVKAALVDPHDANDVAEKIGALITHYDQALHDADLSRANLSNQTWKKVARRYHDIFDKLVPAV